jgi:predicted PurR-regulated permease PerM
MPENQRDLTRTVLSVLSIGGLIGFSFWILRPFLGSIIWATTIVVSTWSVMLAVQARLWGKRKLAVAVMTLALLSLLIVPFSLAIGMILMNVDAIESWAGSLRTFKVPPPPAFLESLPLVGGTVSQAWGKLATTGVEGLVSMASPYIGSVIQWFVAQIGSFGVVFVQFLLTVVVSAILYARGEYAAGWVRRFTRRLAGPRGEGVVVLAGRAIRGVAMGVVVTALLQSVAGGISLAIAGVPFAAVLTAVMFLLAVAQIGPLLVLAPAVVWLYWGGSTGWGTFLLVCTIVVGTMDNFIRPVLIRKGADLPLLLIFSGVIGGLVSFGLIGIFVGPVVLAVAYTLLENWMTDESARGAVPTGADTGKPAGIK